MANTKNKLLATSLIATALMLMIILSQWSAGDQQETHSQPIPYQVQKHHQLINFPLKMLAVCHPPCRVSLLNQQRQVILSKVTVVEQLAPSTAPSDPFEQETQNSLYTLEIPQREILKLLSYKNLTAIPQQQPGPAIRRKYEIHY